MNEFYVKEAFFFSILAGIMIVILRKSNKIRNLQRKDIRKIVGIATIASLLVAIILTILKYLESKNIISTEVINTGNGQIENNVLWLHVIISGLAIPVIEEAIFRVGIYAVFEKIVKGKVQVNSVLCILGTNYVFARMHEGVIQSTYAMIIGTIMSVLYLKYRKNALVPIIFHLSFNLIGIIMETIIFMTI